MAQVTRTGFCPRCAARNWPQKGQIFYAFGNSSGKFKVCTCNCNGEPGFTPHLYETKMIDGDNIIVKSVCCMLYCGATRDVVLKNGDKTYDYKFKDEEWEQAMWPIERWNALTHLHKTNIFTWQYLV